MEYTKLIHERYSVRKYRKDPVEEEKIAAILEAARVAPTAKNCQPQKIYLVRSEKARKALADVTPCTFDAPIVFAVCYDAALAAEGKVYPGYSFGNTDAAIICCHMMLEARNQGLGSCWVGWFNEQEVKTALGLPDGIRVCDLLPIGYPAEDAAPSPRHLESRNINDMVETI